jgi:putative FmdB family regulatory protein
MPTYEYLCNKCEHAFEVVQSFNDPAISECPKCDGKVRKVYNNVGVVFKGSGFYKNDSRTPSAAKSESKIDNKSSPSDAAIKKKDSNPITKSEPE